MNQCFKSVLLVLLLTLLPCNAEAGKLYAKVVGVSDGDTITVLTPMRAEIKVRLAEIDAPEKDQPYGEASKKFLSMLVFGKEVTIETSAKDRYGRAIGRVSLNGKDVNLELVKSGMAWAYLDYLTDQAIVEAETLARETKQGLWALQEDQRVPPWEWRKGDTAKPPVAANDNNKAVATCGAKRYCKEMKNCAEAKFYLAECGLSRLDGDGDGIPCEKICR